MSAAQQLDVPAIVNALELLQAHVSFDRSGHTYRIKGKPHVSVTTLLGLLDKPALKFWAANVQQEADLVAFEDWLKRGQEGDIKTVLDREKHAFKRYTKKAKDIGTEAHELIEFGLRQQLKPTDAEPPRPSSAAMYVYSGWKKWADEVGFRPLAIETTVFSERHRVCGRFDCLGAMDKHPLLAGRPVLTDWKSAKDLYEEHTLQAIAYHGLFSEMVGVDPSDIASVLVRLPKDTPEDPEVRIVEWDGQAFEAVMALALLHAWRKSA